jgi:hypothetical protein
MTPSPPFWFKQRQCKAEPAGDNVLKVSGPNLGEAYLSIRPAPGGGWLASVRLTPDGPDAGATSEGSSSPTAAWSAAFELYRNQVIV